MPLYESSTGTALAAIETLTRHISGLNGYGSTSVPTMAQVELFRNHAYYKIAAALVDAGYSMTQTDAEVLGFLQNLQVIETVIMIELSRPITGPGEPNERFMAFLAERDQLYELLRSGMLAGIGATALAGETGYITATGISVSRKDSVAADSDFVAPRFARGAWSQPGSPGTTRLSAETLG